MDQTMNQVMNPENHSFKLLIEVDNGKPEVKIVGKPTLLEIHQTLALILIEVGRQIYEAS